VKELAVSLKKYLQNVVIFSIIILSDEKRVVINFLFYREFMVGANKQKKFMNLLLNVLG
jgi:hypothetical protein